MLAFIKTDPAAPVPERVGQDFVVARDRNPFKQVVLGVLERRQGREWIDFAGSSGFSFDRSQVSSCERRSPCRFRSSGMEISISLSALGQIA